MAHIIEGDFVRVNEEEVKAQNEQAVLTNAFRYHTLRRISLLPADEQRKVSDAMQSVILGQSVIDGATFDKMVDAAGVYLATPPKESA